MKRCTLNSHIDAVHEGKKRFKCSFCNEDFSKKVDKKIHISTVHKEEKALLVQSLSSLRMKLWKIKGNKKLFRGVFLTEKIWFENLIASYQIIDINFFGKFIKTMKLCHELFKIMFIIAYCWLFSLTFNFRFLVY